jgi:hypothetical protein
MSTNSNSRKIPNGIDEKEPLDVIIIKEKTKPETGTLFNSREESKDEV